MPKKSDKKSNPINQFTARVGRFFCISMCITYLIMCICYIFVPEVQQSNLFSYQGVKSFTETSLFIKLFWSSMGVFGLFGIGLVLVFYDQVREQNRIFMAWLSVIGIIGFILMALYAFRLIIVFPQITLIYPLLEGTQGPIFLKNMEITIKNTMLIYAFPSIWMVFSSMLAFDNRIIPRPLVLVGMIIGGLFLVYGIGVIFELVRLRQVTFTIGFFLVPVWCIWEAIYLNSIIKNKG